MREIKLPPPRACRRLKVFGPQSPHPYRTPREVIDLYRRSLEEAAEEIAEEATRPSGWMLWWGAFPAAAFPFIETYLWADDDQGGQRSRQALTEVLESAGFIVVTSPRPSTPADGMERPLIVQHEDALVGSAIVPQLDYAVEPDREDIHIERHFDHGWQTCPWCREKVQPRDLVAGHPTVEAACRIALGEWVLGDCMRRDQGDVICPSCWRSFFSS